MKKILLMFILLLASGSLVQGMVTEEERQTLEQHGYEKAFLLPDPASADGSMHLVLLIKKGETEAKVFNIKTAPTAQTNVSKEPISREYQLCNDDNSVAPDATTYPDIRTFYSLCEPNHKGLDLIIDENGNISNQTLVGHGTLESAKKAGTAHRKKVLHEIRVVDQEVIRTSSTSNEMIKRQDIISRAFNDKVAIFAPPTGMHNIDKCKISILDPYYLQAEFGLSIPIAHILLDLKIDFDQFLDENGDKNKPLDRIVKQIKLVMPGNGGTKDISLSGQYEDPVRLPKNATYQDVVTILKEQFKNNESVRRALQELKRAQQKPPQPTPEKETIGRTSILNLITSRSFLIAAGVAAAIVAVGAFAYKKYGDEQ